MRPTILAHARRATLQIYGVYSSALPTGTSVPAFLLNDRPPATSACPLGSIVIVALMRGVLKLPVSVHVRVEGSNRVAIPFVSSVGYGCAFT